VAYWWTEVAVRTLNRLVMSRAGIQVTFPALNSRPRVVEPSSSRLRFSPEMDQEHR
jgi:hypothetical protein